MKTTVFGDFRLVDENGCLQDAMRIYPYSIEKAIDNRRIDECKPTGMIEALIINNGKTFRFTQNKAESRTLYVRRMA